jgi:hypothetical protein
MKFNITGLSLLELRDKYGLGSKGFYEQDWYLNELFAKEKPKPGVYEIDFGEKLVNMTFAKQKKKIKKGFTVAHPAIITEAILSYYKNTGNRLMGNFWSRTSSLDSGGFRVVVGLFDSFGLSVYCYSDGYYIDNLGLAAARKCGNLKLESLSLDESLPLELTINGYIYVRKGK